MISAISMSKIRKSKETRKNWKEKGRCEGFMTENPHSNWEFVSFFWVLSFFTSTKALRKIKVNKIEIIHRMEIFIISLDLSVI